MTSTTHRRTVIVAVSLLLVVGGLPGGAVGDDPETADEALSALRQYEGSEALSTYSEFEVMRGQAVTAVQTGDFTETDLERMRAVLVVLNRFTAAYAAASNGSVERSLTLANETAAGIDRLRRADGESYATLARLGLDRFYRQRGEALYEQSRETTNTSAELRYLESSAHAFQAAGASNRYSTVSSEASRLRAVYRADQERLRSALAAADAFVTECGSTCGSPTAALTGLGPGVFARYPDARSAAANADVAARLAAEHGLTTMGERAEALTATTDEALFSLSIAATLLALVYALVLGGVGGAVAWRTATWAEDVDGATVGRIVPREPVEVSDQ